MIVIVYIARVLIHQMLNIVLAIHHQHQRYDGKLTTCTCSKIALSAIGIGLDGGNKLIHIACFDGFARFGIHLAGIFVRWIMREIATDYEQIFVCKIWFQHIGHALKFVVVVGRNDDRHYWWHIAKSALKEWQLNLQTMFLRMSRTVIGKNAISLSEIDGCFVGNFYIA